jgi:hypothetical protein
LGTVASLAAPTLGTVASLAAPSKRRGARCGYCCKPRGAYFERINVYLNEAGEGR